MSEAIGLGIVIVASIIPGVIFLFLMKDEW